jgi:Tol biopolymer transport system component
MPDITSRLAAALADRYAIERQIGAGGMATVFLALDLRHNRKVAVKVLQPELSAILGGERFLKEIEVTANLQHPNILPLYDSGEADSFLYYVMPYVEGDTLRDRLNAENQLGVEETVTIAKGVAAALEFAHERGVVHRDIKPENILLQAGQPLVADFGIALAVSQAGGTRLTETGLSLGTPHYMSPEQAAGDRTLDARTDIYSLGAMVYEMLVGEPPYVGNSVQAIVAKILSDTPTPITRTRTLVPPNVDAAVQRALAKSPADRFTSAAKFAEALVNPGYSLPTTTMSTAAATARRVPRLVLGAAALVLAAVAGAALWSWLGPQGRAPEATQRYRILLSGSGSEAAAGFLVGAALAPDGSAIVFSDTVGSERIRLWVKERNAREAHVLEGTEYDFGSGGAPLFSPDGEWIAFVQDYRLRKVSRTGGGIVTLLDSAAIFGAWMDDGTILAVDPSQQRLVRVSDRGGPPEVLLDGIDDGRSLLHHVSALPGSRGVLFTTLGQDLVSSDLRVLEFGGGEVRTLLDRVSTAWYLPDGLLLYSDLGGNLFVAPFDLGDLTVGGPGIPVLEPARMDNFFLWPDLQVSMNGTVLYVPAAGTAAGSVGLVWVDRAGSVTDFSEDWRITVPRNGGIALSPDGSKAAINVLDPSGRADLYIKQLPDGPASRLTFEGAQNIRPTWSPDGRRVMFVSSRAGAQDLWVKRADGVGSAELLVDRDRPVWEGFWSPDGAWVVYRTGDEAAGRGDILGFRPGVDTADVPLVATSFEETGPSLSPDGRWLAYASDETGRKEVYVRPFPNVADGRWQISSGGGSEPGWARNGRELFFRSGRRMMVVRYTSTGGFAAQAPEELFSIAAVANDDGHFYSVSPDGQRFLMVREAEAGLAGSVNLILIEHWLPELEAALRRD